MIGEWHEKAYIIAVWISYLIFGIAWMGIVTIKPHLLDTMNAVLGLYVGLFLLYNFNPYTNKKVSYFGRGIAFTAGIFVFLTNILFFFPSYTKYKELTKMAEMARALRTVAAV